MSRRPAMNLNNMNTAPPRQQILIRPGSAQPQFMMPGNTQQFITPGTNPKPNNMMHAQPHPLLNYPSNQNNGNNMMGSNHPNMIPQQMPQVSLVKEHPTEQEFADILNSSSNDVVVVDFSAVWCGPCKAIYPTVVAYAQEYQKYKVKFVKVDVEKESSIAEQFGIESMPTFLFFHKGKILDTVKGANAPKIKTAIENSIRKVNEKKLERKLSEGVKGSSELNLTGGADLNSAFAAPMVMEAKRENHRFQK